MSKNQIIIPIAFICEEINIKPLSIALVSLLENTGNKTKYDISILTKRSYTQNSLDLINIFKGKYNCDITFLKINETVNSVEEIGKLISINISNINRCIYLNHNVVVQKDLSSLFNLNKNNYSISGVREVENNDINSNVLLLDCVKIRQNIIKIGKIDLKYNLQAFFIKGEKSFNFGENIDIKNDLIEKFDQKELLFALQENVIFSYNDLINPFNSSDCCFFQEWWSYFKLTQFNKLKRLPKVSVIIPVFNVEKYISECLYSVINQTLQDIEIILIDDGSTDKSMEIIRDFASYDDRITILQQENQGAGAARNKGLEIARGEYLSFLDSDDFFELTMLEQTYNKAKETDVDIVVFNYLNYNQSTNKFVPILRQPPKTKDIFSYKDIPNHIFGGLHHNAWSKLYKTEFVKSNNIKFQHLFRVNDIFFVHTSIVLAKSITYINKHLAYYRIGMKDNSQSTLYKHPLSFYEAEIAIFKRLNEVGVYQDVEKSFLNCLLGISIDNLNRVNDINATKTIYNHLKDNLDKDFGITSHPQEYYYPKLYDIFLMIQNNTFDEYASLIR